MSSNVTPTGASPTGARPAQTGAWQEALRNRWFVGCVALLALCGAGFHLAFRGTVIRKDPLYLRKSLELLEKDKLIYRDPVSGNRWSYQQQGPADQLQPEMVNELGTSDYVGWQMKIWDDSAKRATGEVLHAFIAYYTGKPDQVPHVAEQCMLGNGFRPISNRLIPLTLPGVAEKDQSLSANMFLFEGAGDEGPRCQMVMYLFRANDQWKADRDGVRWVIGDPFVKYAYFSKVEISMRMPPGFPKEAVDHGIATGTRFLQAILPVLIKEHWPIWPTDDKPVATRPAA